MLRLATSFATLCCLAGSVAAADPAGAGEGLGWQPVAQTLVAVALLVLLARGSEGEQQDDRRRAKGRGLMSSLSSGRW